MSRLSTFHSQNNCGHVVLACPTVYYFTSHGSEIHSYRSDYPRSQLHRQSTGNIVFDSPNPHPPFHARSAHTHCDACPNIHSSRSSAFVHRLRSPAYLPPKNTHARHNTSQSHPPHESLVRTARYTTPWLVLVVATATRQLDYSRSTNTATDVVLTASPSVLKAHTVYFSLAASLPVCLNRLKPSILPQQCIMALRTTTYTSTGSTFGLGVKTRSVSHTSITRISATFYDLQPNNNTFSSISKGGSNGAGHGLTSYVEAHSRETSLHSHTTHRIELRTSDVTHDTYHCETDARLESERLDLSRTTNLRANMPAAADQLADTITRFALG